MRLGKLHLELAELWSKQPKAKRGKGRHHRLFIAAWMLEKMGWPENWFREGEW